MSFPKARLEERHGKGDPRGNVLARFLGSFFAARQRMNNNTSTPNAHEVQCEAVEEVVKNSSYLFLILVEEVVKKLN